jgi:hypothetical protein
MKKLSLISLAVAAALAICPAALVAQSFDFTFTSLIPPNGDTAIGTLVTGASIGGGGYDITSGAVTLYSPTNGTETFNLVQGNAIPPGSITPPPGVFTYDNILYPTGDGSGGYLTNTAGLLFMDGSSVMQLNLWGNNNTNQYGSGTYNPTDYTYGLWTETNGSWGPTEDAGTFTLTAVPEGGASLLYLLLAGGACFGAMFFSRNRFANLASA